MQNIKVVLGPIHSTNSDIVSNQIVIDLHVLISPFVICLILVDNLTQSWNQLSMSIESTAIHRWPLVVFF